jgi:LysW-gamma-L-lysine carboxypeptidase
VNLAPPDSVITFYAEERPFRADKNTSLSRAFRFAIREAGGKPAFKVKTGTSDMNVVGPVWDCPIVAYGPGDSDLDHTPNEHIELQEYGQAIAVLTDVLVALSNE